MRLFRKRQAFVVRQGDAIVDEHYGPGYTPELYVEWGSITKLVTAHAVARAVAQGRLDYDAPARGHLPELPGSVTIRSLVTHTSGLPRVHDGMPAGFFADPYQGTTPAVVREHLARLSDDTLISPGETSYSNLGFAALGMILEREYSTTWFDVVRALVLRPLGITETAVDPPAGQRAQILGFNRKPHPPWDLANSAYAAAGALWSPLRTVADYGTRIAETGGYAVPERAWQRDGNRFWHNGQTRDAGSCLILDPDTGLLVVTHTLARLPGAADRLAGRLASRTGA